MSDIDALVVGAGPAGLMAAEVMAGAGLSVVIAEGKPSPARKFLMAGKSGLNITNDQRDDAFQRYFDPLPDPLSAALADFGPRDVVAWGESLGQSFFTGSSGRVFPDVMKASPLLRAWLKRLEAAGVELRRNWRMTGIGAGVEFMTPAGPTTLNPRVTVLALGGASWARLGSDGAWVDILSPLADLAPFAPANAALAVDWSPHMASHFGRAAKGVSLSSGPYRSRGEFIISNKGMEGGGIYAVSRGVREGHPLVIDLLPDWSDEKLAAVLAKRKPKESIANTLRKTLKLPAEKVALLMEFARDMEGGPLACVKALPVTAARLRPIDEAISTAGGVVFTSITSAFALKTRPDIFVAGEMLDWEAPTGGYLLTACLATGRAAGLGAISAVRALQAG